MAFFGRTRKKFKEMFKINNKENKEDNEIENIINNEEKIQQKQKINITFFGEEMLKEDAQLRKLASIYNQKYTISKLLGHFSQAYAIAYNSLRITENAFHSALKNVSLITLKIGRGTIRTAGRTLGYNDVKSKYETKLDSLIKQQEIELKKMNNDVKELILKNNSELKKYDRIKTIIQEQLKEIDNYREMIKEQEKRIDTIAKEIDSAIRDEMESIQQSKKELENEEKELKTEKQIENGV